MTYILIDMKPLHHFVVRIPQKFKDKINVGGIELELVSKFNEFEHRINYGHIVAAPVGFKDAPTIGQILYFHHHVVMEQMYDIGDDLYLVNYDPEGGYANHAIAIQDEADRIHMLGDWCFVLPNDEEEETTTASGIILEINKEPKLEGELLSIPKGSEWIGASDGDVVGYTKNSDYAMSLQDGTQVYRMRITELVYVKEEE
jgi:co-chaperonin GroES (HSP10)